MNRPAIEFLAKFPNNIEFDVMFSKMSKVYEGCLEAYEYKKFKEKGALLRYIETLPSEIFVAHIVTRRNEEEEIEIYVVDF